MIISVKSLRDELAEVALPLAEALERSWVTALDEWLPALGVKNDSFNSYPHLRNVESQATSIVREFEYIHPQLTPMLQPVEVYLLLMGCLMHDIGRIFDDNGHGSLSSELILKDYAVLGIPSRALAQSLASVCEYHTPMAGQTQQSLRWKYRIVSFYPYGQARELLLATMVMLADVLDGAFTRVLPWYLKSPSNGLAVVGAFRNIVQAIHLDARCRMAVTVLGEVSTDEPAPAESNIIYRYNCSDEQKASCKVKDDCKKEKEDYKKNKQQRFSLSEKDVLLCCTYTQPKHRTFDHDCPHLSEVFDSIPIDVSVRSGWQYWWHEHVLLLSYAWTFFDLLYKRNLSITVQNLSAQSQAWYRIHSRFPPDDTGAMLHTIIKEIYQQLDRVYSNEGTSADQTLKAKWQSTRVLPMLQQALQHAAAAKWLPEILMAARQLLFHLTCFAIYQQEQSDNNDISSRCKSLEDRRPIFDLHESLKSDASPYEDFHLLRRYLSDRRLNLYLNIDANKIESHKKMYGHIPITPNLPRAFHAAHWLVAHEKLQAAKDEPAHWPTAVLLATVLADAERNGQILTHIATELSEYGLPIYAWLIEYREGLYTCAGKETFEPILSRPFLQRVADSMWELSRRVFGMEEFSYQMLADHLNENNLETVRIAVRRLAIVTRYLRRQLADGYNVFIAQDTESDPGATILCNDTNWRWVVTNRQDQHSHKFDCCLLLRKQGDSDLLDCRKCPRYNASLADCHCNLATYSDVKYAINRLNDPF